MLKLFSHWLFLPFSSRAAFLRVTANKCTLVNALYVARSRAEGQRKANFEECDAKKRESQEKIGRLKTEVKELQVEFAKAKNVRIFN